MRLFELHRIEDESGVSGTGIVAQGVIFDNDWCAMTWLTEHTSVAFYASIHEVEAIHGHNGKTRVVRLEPPSPPPEAIARIREVIRHELPGDSGDHCDGLCEIARLVGLDVEEIIP